MALAYLAARNTLPGPERRDDAYEHDLMMGTLRPAAQAAGTTIEAVAWDADIDFGRFDAAIIGTTWDYADQLDRFVERLAAITQQCALFNPLSMVSWNLDKRYLRDLEARGVACIPTLWVDRADATVIAEAFATLDCDTLVAKRQVGGGAFGQVRLLRGGPVPELPHAMMLQPYLPSIVEEGELSFVFVEGAFSHALRKRPKAGDYRIQSLYGGTEAPLTPAPADLAVAQRVVDALENCPLYGRVDLIRGPEGRLCLMELELVEPFLYPVQGPELGKRLIEAALRRL
ncbi:MAG: hypothetical protein AAGA48_18690 [Myxococcota bacterium]